MPPSELTAHWTSKALKRIRCARNPASATLPKARSFGNSLQASTSEPQYSSTWRGSIGPLPTTRANRKSASMLISFGCSVAGGSGNVSCPRLEIGLLEAEAAAVADRRAVERRHACSRPPAFDGRSPASRGRDRARAGSRRRASGCPSCGRHRPSRDRPGSCPSMNSSIPSRMSAGSCARVSAPCQSSATALPAIAAERRYRLQSGLVEVTVGTRVACQSDLRTVPVCRSRSP